MITFPNAKINLGLNIVEKRPDGYHNLETVFYPVPLEDALEVNILHEGNEKFRLHQAGLEIEGEVENNLVVKAYKLLDEKGNPLPGVTVIIKGTSLGTVTSVEGEFTITLPVADGQALLFSFVLLVGRAE